MYEVKETLLYSDLSPKESFKTNESFNEDALNEKLLEISPKSSSVYFKVKVEPFFEYFPSTE